MDFNNTADGTLNDTLTDGYVTAEENTGYLSALETTADMTLSDLNISLGNNLKPDLYSRGNEEEELNTVDINGQQVVVFTIDGRDELYGVQFIQDEQGNLQKYQFQLRTLDDGQLEAIPETITLLPLDDETAETEISQDNYTEEAVGDTTLQGEHMTSDALQQLTSDLGDNLQDPHIEECGTEQVQLHASEDDAENNDAAVYEEEFIDQENEEEVDSKAGIIEEHYANIKQELFQEELNANSNSTVNNVRDIGQHEETTNDMESENGETHCLTEDIFTEEHGPENLRDLNVTDSCSNDIYPPNAVIQDDSCSDTGEPYEEIFIQGPSGMDDNENDKQLSYMDQEQNSEEGETSFNQSSENIENDSDNDDYHIVEGLHITGDVEEANKINQQNISEGDISKSYIPSADCILQKQYVTKSTTPGMAKKDSKTVFYYVVRQTEKENLDSLSILNATLCKPLKANPRSILKNSHIGSQITQEQTFQSERFSKRFARSKEAKQERSFINFINQTTIPTEPVRKNRLPRKQKIKPIKRMDDEEIVVQEVVVSSSGFVETIEDGVLKSKEPLKVTETVTLTDSDDEYDPKQGHRRKRRNRKHREKIEITISDSSDSDGSVIEVLSDGEKTTDKTDVAEVSESGTVTKKVKGDKANATAEIVGSGVIAKKGKGKVRKKLENKRDGLKSKAVNSLKRSRGRNSCSSETQEDSESPSKKSKTDDSEDSPISKNEITCPECDKTFASQNSLKTHLQHHNLQNSINNAQLCKTVDAEKKTKDTGNKTNKESSNTELSVSSEQPQSSVDSKGNKGLAKAKNIPKAKVSVTAKKVAPAIVYKHKCTDCENTFKNTILLNKHVCPKKNVDKFSCTICRKTFSDASQWNNHKRSHVKEKLAKSTNAVSVSPKKMRASVAVSSFKSPKKFGSYKCKECGKICSSLTILNAHAKTHKSFICSTCKTSFSSRILLDTHLREKCVKTGSPHNKRLSFRTKKAFSPRSVSARFSTRASTRRSTVLPKESNTSVISNTSSSFLQLPCDSCEMKFHTHAKLFDHKVIKHGLNTPDKDRIVNRTHKKSLYKERGAFGGVPASAKLSSAYGSLKSKLFDQDS